MIIHEETLQYDAIRFSRTGDILPFIKVESYSVRFPCDCSEEDFANNIIKVLRKNKTTYARDS